MGSILIDPSAELVVAIDVVVDGCRESDFFLRLSLTFALLPRHGIEALVDRALISFFDTRHFTGGLPSGYAPG